MSIVILVEHLNKQYDLSVIGTGTISRDLNRWWARVRKQPDPYTRIGEKDAYQSLREYPFVNDAHFIKQFTHIEVR